MFHDRRLLMATFVILLFIIGACTNIAGMFMSGMPSDDVIMATIDPAATATATPFKPRLSEIRSSLAPRPFRPRR